MPKLTKAESARINGAKSRGPKTPQGRATSSLNAIQHGITAKTLILQNENRDLFLEMFNAYCDLFQPANQIEIDLVGDIAAARWRLGRVWRYQTAMLDLEMDNQTPEFKKRYEKFDEDIRGAAAYSAIADNSKGYVTALRADIHLTRAYRKAVDELRCLRAEKTLKLQNEPKDPNLTPMDSTPDAKKISTEPNERKPHASAWGYPVGQVPDLPMENHEA
jgi:hypothetical protein